MNCQIEFSDSFLRQLKKLAKRHRSLKSDVRRLVTSLTDDPLQGTLLFPGVRKVRLAITSKGRGKRGGARVITYLPGEPLVDETVTVVLALIMIYDKSDAATVSDQEIIKIIINEISEEE